MPSVQGTDDGCKKPWWSEFIQVSMHAHVWIARLSTYAASTSVTVVLKPRVPAILRAVGQNHDFLSLILTYVGKKFTNPSPRS